MEIRNLRYFLAVAREENMSRAAELLHVTQPTLSKALKSLEEELGKKLFTRHSFSIKLTDEGMLLRDRAEDLVLMADKIEQEFVSLDDITGGDIYFGLAESYQICHLAREIKKLKDRFPSFIYHITSGDTEQVTEKLDKGLLDFGVICETPNKDKYDYVTFPDTDRWGAIILKSHPLAKKKSIKVADLIGQPLFCSEQSWNIEIPEWAGENFSKLHLEGSFRLSYNASMFAKEGLGILLTFEHLIDCSEESDLVFRPLSPKQETKLYLIWNKYQTFTPIAEKFLAQVRATF
ncbi:LysR family transcriptional regulator [Butyrivibrio sp. YAB3001]|uniref:LysR family transcriptional regulator n=1 Tax=Butyrivibrio sp. YAB3001 TaxID=1520812 RepID=UPI0008F668AA|nr:LysR family transcriptional regulator [Butyrivibrio sp. YAB3001]SFC28564.1 DNA-binding transcriptional regulator, LysR family [Butyrivibrio sp. YAB3001]